MPPACLITALSLVSSSGLRGPPEPPPGADYRARIRAVSGKTKAVDHFLYRDGRLFVEGVPVETIARGTGTSLSILYSTNDAPSGTAYSAAFQELAPTVCYAVQAQRQHAVIATLAWVGAGADVVSGGEPANSACSGRSRRPDRLFRDR